MIIQVLSNSRYTNNAIFVVLCVLVAALTLEAALVKTYNLVGSATLSTFILITAAYVVGQYYILEFVGRKIEEMKAKRIFQITVHRTVKVIQYLLSVILVLLILQMLLTSIYYTATLALVTTISYSLAIFMLGLLTKRFVSWFRLNRNIVVLFYALASAALSINVALTLAFVYGPFLVKSGQISKRRSIHLGRTI